MKLGYRELDPPPALQPWVDCFWQQSFSGSLSEESPQQYCVPLGMVDLIFHVDDNRRFAQVNDCWEQLPTAFVVGIYTDAVSLRSRGDVNLFGCRLKPECLLQLFNIPPAALFNDFTSLDNFFGRGMNELAERISEAPDTVARMALMEAFLLKRLGDVKAGRNYLVEATRMIRASGGNISISELSGNLYVSERQLQRSFKDTLGTNPKTYLRIIRFRNVYQHVQQARRALNWADVTYSFGYADQAHFIRDFRSFSGTVPGNLLRNSNDFYQLSSTGPALQH